MSNVSDVRPWFKSDLKYVLMAVYFAMKFAGWRMEASKWIGVVHALAALAKAFGVDAASFMTEADVRLIGD